MAKKKILFISGSLGLGHITRDLAIARELYKQTPEVELSWLAGHTANTALREAGEHILPEAELYSDDNIVAENTAQGFQLNIVKYAISASKKEWLRNVKTLDRVTSRERFDLVIGDETYEIGIAFRKDPDLKKAPFVIIYDFVGLESMTRNPMEKLGAYYWNRVWTDNIKHLSEWSDLALFLGEEEDVPDRKFGPFLPNRRQAAKAQCKFVGYVLSFDTSEHFDKATIRTKLGYGEEPLIVCSIGGTAIGRDLLELCGQAYRIIREEISDVRMVLVCGPRLDPESLDVPEGVDVRGYVPALYEHLAVCDLGITQGGAATTLELTALGRPFLYFPLQDHCEQRLHVAERVARHHAGVRMEFSQTTPDTLAQQVIAHLGKETDYASIPTDGAQKAVQLIGQLL